MVLKLMSKSCIFFKSQDDDLWLVSGGFARQREGVDQGEGGAEFAVAIAEAGNVERSRILGIVTLKQMMIAHCPTHRKGFIYSHFDA